MLNFSYSRIIVYSLVSLVLNSLSLLKVETTNRAASCVSRNLNNGFKHIYCLLNFSFSSSSSLASAIPVSPSQVATLLSMANRWVRPEVYPLFAAVGVAIGICGMQLVRNICINPEVRVNKKNRAAGVLENFAEGEKYSEHFVRRFSRNRSPEIMPTINSFFAGPSRN